MSPFEAELSKIESEYSAAIRRSQYDDASDILNKQEVASLQTRCIASVERATGRNSIYFKSVSAPKPSNDHEYNRLAEQVGVVRALLHDIQSGYTKSLEELIHGSLFSDFLEMADHLLSTHYKDAAAVIVGSTLEAHLRQLCLKALIPLENSSSRPKAADALNSDLATAGVYSKLIQKNVTAWLGLRNNAAHGSYGAYDEQQVRLFLDGVRHFITQNPA